MSKNYWTLCRESILVGLVTVVSTACASGDQPVVTETRTVTVEASATAATTTVAPVTLEPTTRNPTSLEPTAVERTASAPPIAPAVVELVAAVMPAVVCMNLQSAQNLIQQAGVFYSRSADATGQGRMQVNDSNWIVIDQEPAVGTPFSEGDAVLSVVKIGEPNTC